MLFLYSSMEGGLKWVSTGLILTLYQTYINSLWVYVYWVYTNPPNVVYLHFLTLYGGGLFVYLNVTNN